MATKLLSAGFAILLLVLVIGCGQAPIEPTEPVATEPEATEPVATEPEATEPVATEPLATEPEVEDAEEFEPIAPPVPKQ